MEEMSPVLDDVMTCEIELSYVDRIRCGHQMSAKMIYRGEPGTDMLRDILIIDPSDGLEEGGFDHVPEEVLQ